MANERGLYHCVKCGGLVAKWRVDTQAENGFPAACDLCEMDVMDEVENESSMWPSGWFGHAWKASGDSTWQYDKMPPTKP